MNATQALVVVQDPTMPAKATEDEMLRWLWRHFVSNSWAPIPQVTVSPIDLDPTAATIVPYDGPEPPNDGNDRRIDMLVGRRGRTLPKTGLFETMAIEVKVTRADFLADVRNPAKQAPWRAAATRHTYAVPAGLVMPDEVPEGCGLLWVTPPGNNMNYYADVRWVKRAPYTPGHRPELPNRVLVALIYRLAWFEGRTRGWQAQDPVQGSEQEARADLVAATKQVSVLERKVERLEQQADAWKKAYALAVPDGLPCAICGRPVKPIRPVKHWFSTWRHVDPTDGVPCALADAAIAESDAREAYALATTQERERRLRAVHRFGLDEVVDASPWRGWLRAPHEPSPAGAADIVMADRVTRNPVG